jgi:NNP family nitrate/nitrite transporter-like MFS transporter
MKLLEAVRSGRPSTLLAAFLYFDVSFMVWVILGPLAPYIASDFGLSDTEKGLLVAVPILGGALLRIPMGILTDRVGPRKAGLAGLFLTLTPLVWGWLWADRLTELMAVGLLLGVAGASFAVALPLAGRWYPKEHQGLAMGIAGAGNSGTVLAALLAPRLAERFGWASVMGLATLPILMVLVLFYFLAQEKSDRPGSRPSDDYLGLLRQTDTGWFCLFYGVTFGGFVGLASSLVIFFHDQYGLSRVAAGNFAAACVFAGSFFRPVGGYLSDRFGGVAVLTLLLTWAGIMMIGVSLLPSLAIVTLLLFLGMVGLGMGNGSVFQIVPRRFGKELGIVTGLVGAAGGLGGFMLPTLLGSLKDFTGSYRTGFLIAGIACFIAVALLHTVYHHDWRYSTWIHQRATADLSSSGRVTMEVVFGG